MPCSKNRKICSAPFCFESFQTTSSPDTASVASRSNIYTSSAADEVTWAGGVDVPGALLACRQARSRSSGLVLHDSGHGRVLERRERAQASPWKSTSEAGGLSRVSSAKSQTCQMPILCVLVWYGSVRCRCSTVRWHVSMVQVLWWSACPPRMPVNETGQLDKAMPPAIRTFCSHTDVPDSMKRGHHGVGWGVWRD